MSVSYSGTNANVTVCFLLKVYVSCKDSASQNSFSSISKLNRFFSVQVARLKLFFFIQTAASQTKKWTRCLVRTVCKWAAPSEFVSSSIPSWQILTAHAQPFRGARDLAFCLKVPLDSLLVWARSEGSGETARMRRLAWTFAARIGDKYQIRLARPK